MSVTLTSSVSLQAIFSTAVTALSKTAIAAGSRYRAEVPPGGGRRRRGRWPSRPAPHQVTEKHQVLTYERTEPKIKISPWNLWNNRLFSIFFLFVFFFNDFPIMTLNVRLQQFVRPGEFSQNSLAHLETDMLFLSLAVAQNSVSQLWSSESDICCSAAGASTRRCLALLSRVILLQF